MKGIALKAVAAALAAGTFTSAAWSGGGATKEIDLSATKVDPATVGIDVGDLIGALKPPKRDEFEGREAFMVRQQAFESTRVLGDLTPSSTIAVIDRYSAGGSNVSYRYLADSGIFVVKAELTPIRLIAEQTSWTWSILKNTEKFEGYSRKMNAYGTAVEVAKKSLIFDGLAFVRTNFAVAPRGPDISHQIRLSPEEARDLAQNLAVLYVGRLTPPYLVEYRTHESPTWSDPTDLTTNMRAVVMDVSQIWTVNTRTGRVYHKAMAPFKANYQPVEAISEPAQASPQQ